MQKLVYWVLMMVAWCPLRLLHSLATLLGALGFYLSADTRTRTMQNVHFSKLAADDQAERRLAKAVCIEAMKGAFELTIAWTRSSRHIVSLFKEVHGWSHIQEAIEQKQGLLLITPHLGSYDLAGRYISEQLPFPLTAMYRPPKIRWLEGIMNTGRERDNGHTAPATLQGVRQVVRALHHGEATIVLPDQVPKAGEGVWVYFFRQPAFTMTLASRLARTPHVKTLFFCGERLAHGRGFALHIAPLAGELNGEREHDAQLINHNVEAWVARFPAQYLFSYNRYKGVPPADMCR